MDQVSLIMLIIGTIFALLYIGLILMGNSQYASYIDGLPDNEHFFKPIYPVGFLVLDKLNYSYSTRLDKKRLKQCQVIYGERFAIYYFRLNYAQKVSLSLLVIPFVFLFYPIVNSPYILFFGLILIICAYWYFDMLITDVIDKRDKEIERELPNILSKLTLLVNAGMILSEAWVRVSETGDTTIYKEMKNAVLEIQNGIDEATAYIRFGDRCLNVEVKKFVSTLVQNITKGNKELVDYLKKQAQLSWEEKKHIVRREGEKAASKLMIPIGIMFIGIIIMIVIPIFTGFSF